MKSETSSKYLPILAGLAACFVYLLTIAPDLTWANFSSDGGELITAAVTSGIPHPPGYPTYLLLGKLFSLLPIGSAAFRFNLLSALAVTGAVGLVTAVARQMAAPQPPPPITFSVGLAFAFAPLVWGQALVAEVYGLNLLFLAAFLWALLGKRPSPLIGLLLGISITTHLTSLLMLPLAFTLSPRSQWPALAAGIGLGLTPFLLLPALAQTNSPVIWGQPTTISGWWWLISGRIYQANLFSLPWPSVVDRAADWAGLLARQSAWVGLPVIALAFFRPEPDHLRPRLALLGTAVLYLLYALTYNANDAEVLLLPVILLMSLLLTPGLQRLGWLAFLLPAALLLLNYNTVNLSGDQLVRPASLALLREAPPNSILLTPGDQTIFTLWYFQHVEKYREDLILIDANLTAFDWYRANLAKRYPDINGLAKDDVPGLRQMNPDRPFCTAVLNADIQPQLNCH